MRRISALMIAGMLAGAALTNPAAAAPRWHYGWWTRGPHHHWRWHGNWGHGGRWVRRGPRWVYRWR